MQTCNFRRTNDRLICDRCGFSIGGDYIQARRFCDVQQRGIGDRLAALIELFGLQQDCSRCRATRIQLNMATRRHVLRYFLRYARAIAKQGRVNVLLASCGLAYAICTFSFKGIRRDEQSKEQRRAAQA